MNRWSDIFRKKTPPNKQELISYLEEKADKKTIRQVEKSMLDNPLLNDAIEGFSGFGAEQIQQTPSFQQFQAQRTSHSKIRKFRPVINKVAATLLLGVLVASIYLYWQDASPTHSAGKVFADSLTEFYDPSIYAVRSSNEASTHQVKKAPTQKQKAILLFQEGKLDKAIPLWESYLATHPEDTQSLYYIGYMYLKQSNSEKAIPLLEKVVNVESDYKDESRFYLGLAYLKSERKEEARAVLQDLVDNGHEFFGKKAQAVLDKI